MFDFSVVDFFMVEPEVEEEDEADPTDESEDAQTPDSPGTLTDSDQSTSST